MVEDPQELILDILRAMRGDIATLKDSQLRMETDIRGIKQQLLDIRGDLLNHEELIAALTVRIERIEIRLGLHETTQ